MEPSVAALGPIDALFLFFVFVFPLALNDDGVLGDFDFDIVLRHSWKVGTKDQLAVTLEDIDLG